MRNRLYAASAQILLAAFIVALGFTLVSLLLEEGRESVLMIGGLYHPAKMPVSQNIAFFVDMAFPIFYGMGLICWISAFSRRANRPLSRILILVVIIVAICDFAENRMIMNGFANPAWLTPYTSVFTTIKYGLVGLAAIGLSVLVPPRAKFHKLVAVFLRFPFPLLLAALVAYGGETSTFGAIVGLLVSLSFLFVLAALAWISWQEQMGGTSKRVLDTVTPTIPSTLGAPKPDVSRKSQVQFGDIDEAKDDTPDTLQTRGSNGDGADGFEPVSYRTLSSKSLDSASQNAAPKTKKAARKKKKKSKK